MPPTTTTPLLGFTFALVLGAALGACSSSNASATTEGAAGGDSSIDGDAGVNLTEPTEPPKCFDTTSCSGSLDYEFTQIFEAPETVELRAVERDVVLGFDRSAKQFVAYWLVEQGGATTLLPEVVELTRLDPKYERVSLAWPGAALACTATSCELVGLSASPGTTALPGDLFPSWAAQGCVAGRGLWCLGNGPTEAAWAARPELFAAPITTFARLGLYEFLVVDETGTAQLVRNGVVSAFDTGTSERIVSLRAGHYRNDQEWAGLTESGKLVRGSLAGGRACSATAESIDVDYMVGFILKDKDAFINVSGSYCSRTAFPSGTFDVGFIGCGIASSPFTIDRRRILATPVVCVFD